MKNALKRSFAILLALAVLAGLCVLPANAASFPESLYLRQITNVSCTRASNTMMCRARAYLSGNDNWSSITEYDLTNCGAWSDSYGMSWNYTLSKSGDGIHSISVSETAVSGLSLSTVKALLDAHPEGFVMYCGRLPHAIFITDYQGDTIYCADPGWGYSGDRRPLTSSYFGTCYGSQANILANVTAYWYVASYNISASANSPIGWLDSVTSEGAGKIHVRGWALDLDSPTTSLDVHVYIGGGPGESGAEGHVVKANLERTDIAAAYPSAGSAHGFDAVISTSKTGNQPVYVYGINVGGGGNTHLNNSGARVNIVSDTTAPTISDIKVSNVSGRGYTVTCKVTDNTGVTKVTMPTWTDKDGQDDLVWHEATISGDTATVTVSISNHNLESGDYLTHIYAYDAAGNQSKATVPVVTLPNILTGATANGTLEDGVYTIANSLNQNVVLDVSGGSKDAGANVQVWRADNVEQQLWYIQSIGDGLYSVRALHSGRYLNVADNSKSSGSNVQQWSGDAPNGEEKWHIQDNGDGTYTFIANVNGQALDLSDGTIANGQNVQCWPVNGSGAQKWVLYRSDVQADFSAPVISDIQITEVSSSGYRVTCTVTDESGVAKVTMPTWTEKNGQDDLVWHEATISGNTATCYINISDHNKEPGNYFTHIYAYDTKGYDAKAEAPVATVPTRVDGTSTTGEIADGVYTIASSLNQNYVLDVSKGSKDAGANVQIWQADNVEQQLWYIKSLGNGLYSLRALHSGRYANVAGSGTANGTNVHQWRKDTPNGDEKWRIQDNGDGTYTFIADVNGLALDLADGKVANGQNVQCWESNGSGAQKWSLIPSSVKEDFYGPEITDIQISEVTPNGFRVTCTVKDPSGVAEVRMPTWTVNNGQDDCIWHEATISGDTATFYVKTTDHNSETGSYTTHIYATDKRGYRSGTAAPTIDVPFGVPDGYYRIASALDNSKGLDIAGGGTGTANGATVQLWTYGGGNNQKFELKYQNGCYTIMALHSDKYLDVDNGSSVAGANVQQYEGNGSAAQQWMLKDAGDGYAYIVNKSGLYLDISNASSDNGTNVQGWTANGSAAQKWKLIPVEKEVRKGYDAGYTGGMAGSGSIVAYGIDVSEHQGTGFNFQNLKDSGYTYVILRCGFVSRKDYCFEEYYAAAKAAGLNVGVYFYSYAENAAEAANEAELCLSYIQGKQFEYPIYFDFEDACARSYNGTLAQEICTAFLSKIEAAGYLPGLYGYASWLDPNYGAWVPTSSICSKWECWMANYYDNSPVNAKSANYPSTYGMYQYTSSNYVNGVGPLDTNVCYKDYPSIVKTYHFNGY